jgi:arylformamidase
MQLLDITPPLSEASPVYPGDTPFSRTWDARIGDDGPANVSTIRLSPHVGAHADAPFHYDPDGVGMDAVPLAHFLGPCRVVHALGAGPLVRPDHLAAALAGATLPPRVLVRTYERSPAEWDPGFTAFAPETIEWLADRGVVLVGIDTPSADPDGSDTLPSHQALRRRGVLILENLRLDAVDPGDYELIALPLPIVGGDASPVRAVLRRH